MANKKVGIYMSSVLDQLKTKTNEQGTVTFSRRLSDVAERYNAIMDLTAVPEMTSNEKMILGEAILGAITPAKIKNIGDFITDTGIPGADEFAEKIKNWTVAEIVAAVENIGI